MRPDRSDAHLPAEEQAKIEEEVRKYFRRITPMRHTKPSRSEYSSDYWDHLASSDQYSSSSSSIPEFLKLQNLLQANPQRLVCDGSEVVEEYVETDYYKDLNRIDKQHHTTGTGFIKVEKASFDLALASDTSPYGGPPCRGNPATNEWIPSADPPVVVPVSHKPNRSETSDPPGR